jgi:hypothetical protein
VPDGTIPVAKLAVNPLARANHTGTQLAATISDFAAAVAALAPAPNSGWAMTPGYPPDKVLNPEACTVTELARVVATLVDTFKARGELS